MMIMSEYARKFAIIYRIMCAALFMRSDDFFLFLQSYYHECCNNSSNLDLRFNYGAAVFNPQPMVSEFTIMRGWGPGRRQDDPV